MGTVTQLFDGLKSAITGAGTRRDPRASMTYGIVAPLTQQDIDAAYRGSGLMRKIIQIPALDMVREWRDWKLDADDVALYPIYIGLAEGSLGESEFADWIRQHLAPKDNAVQESTAGYQRKAER